MKQNDDLIDAIHDLDDSIEKSLAQNGWWNTFFHGLVGAIGGVIGTAIAVTLIALFLQKLTGTPIIGHYVGVVLKQIQQNK